MDAVGILDGPVASSFIRLYMDTMHAAVRDVDRTSRYDLQEFMPPPGGVNKGYLSPMALLTAAKAFTGASTALAKDSDPKAEVYEARVARARMANLYTVLWRWSELRSFASSLSMAWPMAEVTQEAAFEQFAKEYNITGTKMLTSCCSSIVPDTGMGSDLPWLHTCVFSKVCPGTHPG